MTKSAGGMRFYKKRVKEETAQGKKGARYNGAQPGRGARCYDFTDVLLEKGDVRKYVKA